MAGDSSGNGHDGTISGATWDIGGRYGGALSFDGSNDWVTVTDASDLDLTDGMTLEAWVNPSALSGWRTVILKETGNDLAYGLYADDDASRPAGWARIGGGSVDAAGGGVLPLDTWTHLALTYDGAVLRLYVDGVEDGTRSRSGTMDTSSQPLRMGGNSIWGEYFAGLIDEVRIYNRALTAAEIQADMDSPVVPLPSPLPTRSSPIAIDASNRTVWVVNPDNGSATALDIDTLTVDLELVVGSGPTSVAVDALGKVWVTCRDDDEVWVLNAATGAVLDVLQLPRGSEPVSVVLRPDGMIGYIAASATGRIYEVDPLSSSLGAAVDLGPNPRSLAVTGDGTKLLVTRFLSADSGGTVWSVDLATLSVEATIDLPVDTTSIDGALSARGVPNHLVALTIDPTSSVAWVPAKKDNIVAGLFRDLTSMTFETTVRALLASLDLATMQERESERLDIDNSEQPSAATINGRGDLLFVTLQGNNRLMVLDPAQGAEITQAATGLAPQGVVIDEQSGLVFTKDFMTRTVSVFDAAELLALGSGSLTRIAQIQTVAAEALDPTVLLGKQIFYNADDPRMARDGYLSCASCHLDGGHDGRVWDFTDRGEGLRNTISLEGTGGDDGAPLHWSGNFDEVQDFENDIRNAFGGDGFMSDADFLAGTRSDPLGDPKAGLSSDLDALAAYVNSLVDTGRSPDRNADGSMTSEALAGEVLFGALGCDTCHTPPQFTDTNSGLRHDVGTLKPGSGNRLGGPLDGLDAPSLLGLLDSAPYLHDGSAPTLLDVLVTENPSGQHGDVQALTQQEFDELIAYLRQLESAAP